MSPRIGMSDGLSLRVGCLQDIFIYKASYNALTWLHESGKFKWYPRHSSILMTSGYVYPCACYLRKWRVFIHISVGFSIACSDTKAIPEPVKRNSNNASPAFFVSYSIIYKKLRPTRI